MNDYFIYTISKLSFDEMYILGYLLDHSSDSKFKSIKKSIIQQNLNLTLAKLRKSLCTLEAKSLIEIDNSSKEHGIFITNYGKLALEQQLKEEF